MCNSWYHRPEVLLSSKAPKILKAVAEDADTTKDSDDAAAQAEEDETNLDELEDKLVTTKILTEYGVADHEVAKKSNSYRHQAVPCTVFKCLSQKNVQSKLIKDVQGCVYAQIWVWLVLVNLDILYSRYRVTHKIECNFI